MNDELNNDASEPADSPSEQLILTNVLDFLKQEVPDKIGLRAYIDTIDDEQISHLIESVPADHRVDIWRGMSVNRYWPVIQWLQHDTIGNLISALSDAERAEIQTRASAEDLRVFADALPDYMVDAILLDQDEATADELQQALSYEDSQLGRYINKNIIRVRPRISVSSLRQRILKKEEEVVAAYVVDEDGELKGFIPLERLWRDQEDRLVHEIMQPTDVYDHQASFKEVLKSIQSDDALAWYPVIRNQKIVGAFPVSALLWELQDSLVDAEVVDTPSGEEDLFTPVSTAAKIRAFWLCINLATAFLASWVIGRFEVALQEVVALAILMPVVASMGGIAGSQTLAVALRGLALNHITNANLKMLLSKEAKIAAVNGILLGILISIVVGYWFDSFMLGGIILVAIVVNSLAAASSGTLIPFVLKKLKIDPAISGAVILTTVTDVVGFVVFLGLGSLILLG